ncbi:hypothetical protein SeMB42_g06915, partial [Synchytrium endobioticum]
CASKVEMERFVETPEHALRISTGEEIHFFITSNDPGKEAKEGTSNDPTSATKLLWVFYLTVVARMKLLSRIILNVYRYHDSLHPETPLSRDAREQLLQQADYVVRRMVLYLDKAKEYGKRLGNQSPELSSYMAQDNIRGSVFDVGPVPEIGSSHTLEARRNVEHREMSEMWQDLYLKEYRKLYTMHTNFEESVGQIVLQNRVISPAFALRISTGKVIDSFIKRIEPKSLKWALSHAKKETQEANDNGLNRFAHELLWIFHRTIVSRNSSFIPYRMSTNNVVVMMRTHLRKVNHYGTYLKYKEILPSTSWIVNSHWGFAFNPVGPLPDEWPVPERAISAQDTDARRMKDEAVLENCQAWPAVGSDPQTSRSLTEMVELRRYDIVQQDARRDVPLPGRRSLDSFLQLHESRDSPTIGSIVNDHIRQGPSVHQSRSRRFGGSRRFANSVLKRIGCLRFALFTVGGSSMKNDIKKLYMLGVSTPHTGELQ